MCKEERLQKLLGEMDTRALAKTGIIKFLMHYFMLITPGE